MESSDVAVSIIVVNTSSLNISHLTYETSAWLSPLLVGREIRVTEKNSFLESRGRNSPFGALKLQLHQPENSSECQH